MTMILSERAQRIKASPTLALGARANQLKATGKTIFNLTTGEPDFDTPEHIKEAARRALRDGFTKYTATDGIPSLKQAIVNKFARDNHLNYEPKQIIVSAGSKQCLYNLMQALLNPGDEVIIPAPYWVSYPDMALLADGKPIFIPTTPEQHFKITPEQLERAITPKTRLLIINSPSNPSSIAYRKAELVALAEVLLRHPQVFVVTDDIYEHILWTNEPFVNILNVCPELYDRTLVANGVSKTYSMTGWRIGYAAGPATLITAMSNIQSHATANPNSIAQVAAQAAIEGDQSFIKEMVSTYRHRHEVVLGKLATIPGVQCLPADGAFYSFPSFANILAKKNPVRSDIELAEYLLNDAGIAVVPGSAFGTPNCLRFSFATSMEVITEALDRLKDSLARWD